jgi:hypothetical protein
VNRISVTTARPLFGGTWGTATGPLRQTLLREGALVPTSLGLLDSAVAFAYYLQIDVSEYYSVSLALKLGIAALAGLPNWQLLRRNLQFLAIMFFGLLVSAFIGDLTVQATAQFFGFAIHLILTTCMLRPQHYGRYFQTAARVIFLSVVLFLVEWLRGGLTCISRTHSPMSLAKLLRRVWPAPAL